MFSSALWRHGRHRYRIRHRRGLLSSSSLHIPANNHNSVAAVAISNHRSISSRRPRIASHPWDFGTSYFSTASTTIPGSENDDDDEDDNRAARVQERYSRKTPLEHVLLRPSMYIGPTGRSPPTRTWVPKPLPPMMEYKKYSSDDQKKFADVDDPSPEKFQIVPEELGTIPALIKVFDEILVNAADHRQRYPESCTQIDVIIDCGSISLADDDDDDNAAASATNSRPPFIQVRNNGPGIPIVRHPTEHLYIPEMVLGHLLTGSNFDDDQKRLTGGRHGYGAKLTNIFAWEFAVDTVDDSNDDGGDDDDIDNQQRPLRRYRQSWSNNMREAGEPLIEDIIVAGDDNVREAYTCISFVPDLQRLSSDSDSGEESMVIAEEDYKVLCRRVLDVAGCSGSGSNLRVTLNGRDVSVSSFADYIRSYYRGSSSNDNSGDNGSDSAPTTMSLDGEPQEDPQIARPICFSELNDRWTIGVGLSEGGNFDGISFVNSIATSRGGTHVNAIVQQITKALQENVKKQSPELAHLISQGMIRRNLFVAVNSLIENPTFDSQMKEYLTSNPDSFGSSCKIPKAFLREIMLPEEEGGPGIVEEVIRMAKGRQHATLIRQVGGGKKTRRQLMSSVPKLEDAHEAGSASGWDCTLILTEGDSAKALAVAGLEVIGRERYGVFPLRGKFLNVRGAPVAKLEANAEVKALCSIIGLDFEKDYATMEERRELRYGKVMLMTDQDIDGSHIKGLVINFFRHFWPDLLKPPIGLTPEETAENPPFLSSFVTPLLKITRKGSKKKTKSFFSLADYNAWRADAGEEEAQQWSVKYYKGLGTSTPAEAKQYFSAFDNHFRPFHWNSDNDGELLDMVFDKQRAADRREWILDEYDAQASLSDTLGAGEFREVSFEEFINKEIIHFSHADNIRSIPSLIDGLKPSQRKVLYACFKRKLKSEIKVAQLSGYCAEHTAYHHGEVSLQSTIIGMAQDFVGSNNLNLLTPSGQFGTRIMGGADAASPRYIFTHLTPVARKLFPEVDDGLLEQQEDDGQLIEPEYYCPIIPLLLINGTQGIGTGWSTFIPPHNPHDVLEYVYAKLDGADSLPTIRPFARGFSGTIEPRPDGMGFVTFGRASQKGKTTVLIDELPLGCWTSSYKRTLLGMREKGMITNFKEDHTTTQVSFTVTVPRIKLEKMVKSGLEKQFKLKSNLLTSNMHAFGPNQKMLKFSSAEEIADTFFPYRMSLYEDRLSVMQSSLNFDAAVLRNKARFITSVTSGEIDLISGKTSREATTARLLELRFDKMDELQAMKNDSTFSHKSDGVVSDAVSSSSAQFDYLLNMTLSNLAADRIERLRSEASSKDSERKQLQESEAKDLWKHDLDKLANLL